MNKILKKLLVTCSLLMSFQLSSCGSFIDDGSSGMLMKEIVSETMDDGSTKITISFVDDSQEPISFVIPKGQEGSDGNGISSITQQVSEDGKSVQLVIAFTDGRENQIIDVPLINGKDGVSIKNITSKINDNDDVEVTISFEGDIEDKVFTLPKGEKGDQGNGISSIDVTSNLDGSKTLTIKYTNVTMEDTKITIPSGKQGKGIDYIVSSSDSNNYILQIFYSDGNNETVKFDKPNGWLSGVTNPSEELGNVGDFYFNTVNYRIYQKDENKGWIIVCVLKYDESKEVHHVTFEPNGGTLVSSNGECEITHGETFYNNTAYKIPLAVKEGKTFLGWYTSKDKNDPTVGKFTILTPVYSDMTLYAWWSD